MNLLTVVRKFRIDAGHRVFMHEGKCASIHGHSYEFEVHVSALSTDKLGRVLDFSVIKTLIGDWLEENWDHAMILYDKDPIYDLFLGYQPLTDHKHFVLPKNPTAENLARYLLDVSVKLLYHNTSGKMQPVKVVCWETPNCCAIAEREFTL